MARILVHSATGPDDPTRAALALLIAKTAVEEGHDVQVFLAGDGVHLANPETAETTNGLGPARWRSTSPPCATLV